MGNGPMVKKTWDGICFEKTGLLCVGALASENSQPEGASGLDYPSLSFYLS